MVKVEMAHYGSEFTVTTEGGHLLGAFMTGDQASGAALENRMPMHARCFTADGLENLIGFIDEISVQPAYRRKGVGAELMVAALEKFKEIGIKTVYLRAVPERPEWMVDLLRFYWRYGFDIAKDCIDVDDKSLTMKAVL